MMSDYNNNNHFTSEDIRKYLSGKLSAAEMHAIEKAALEDPFLADAIEGMSGSIELEGEFKVASELEILKKEFAQKHLTSSLTRPAAPIRRLQWWKPVAAAAVLLAGAFTAYSLLIKNQPNAAVATVEQKQRENQPATELQVKADSLVPDSNVAKMQQTPPRNDAPVVNATPTKRNSGDAPGPSSTPAPANAKASQDEVSADQDQSAELALARRRDEAAKLKDQNTTDTKKAEEQENVAGLAETIQKPEIKRDLPLASNVFSGIVTDQNKKPLASAIVQVQNSDKAYLTDKNGVFSIPSTDTSLNVLIGSVGFEPMQMQLRNNVPGLAVTLQPSSNELNEVVVVGYGAKKKSSRKGSGSREAIVQDAEPEGGRIAFEKYVEQNKKLSSKDSSIEVVVSFSVNKNGNLSEFKIDKGAGNEYNEEALRLIREGPAWKLFKGRKTRATVMIRF